ncbi:Processing isoform 1 [Hibiscus syriacus]|uniref:Processing isoform 1 n=1 Tax=Hibiscus syriacus TaxID=106335 RepID=A0A6A3AGY2_HIBSY|nr:Processing isoform 1 [Hibiscus syriacus]
MARLSAIVYYDGEIREDETGVVFVSNERVKISFKKNISFEELITKISRKIHVGSSRRISSLQYRFPTSLLSLTYTTFELSNNDNVEMMVESQSNYSDADVEMYTHFVQVRASRGQSLSSHYGLAEQVDQVDSPTTVMCNDFNAIMGRHSSATPYDMYRSWSTNNPYDNIASSSRGRHSSANFFDHIAMPSTQPSVQRASSRLFDLNVAQTVPPAHMYEADYGAMYGPEFVDMPHLGDYGYYSSINNVELSLGMEFSSKEEAVVAIKNYNIRNCVQSRVDRSTTEKYGELGVNRHGYMCNYTYSAVQGARLPDACQILGKARGARLTPRVSMSAYNAVQGHALLLRLGCGYGLHGIFACLKAKPTAGESLTPSRQTIAPTVHFYAGDWEELPSVLSVVRSDVSELTTGLSFSFSEEDFLDGCSSQDGSIMAQEISSRRSRRLSRSRAWERAIEIDQGEGGYDVILMTEIPYPVSSLKKLYALIKKCLRPPYGVVYLARKNYVGYNSAARHLRSLVDEEGIFGAHLIKEVMDRDIWKFFLK